MHRFIRGAWAAVAVFIPFAALAALPQPGLWSFDGEANGKPGRGLQIDRQGGGAVIVSYYGYRADGSATFLQAVGTMVDGKTLEAPLVEYRNGPPMVGERRSGEVAGVAGVLKMTFDTEVYGSVTLPGDLARPVSRFVYTDHRARLNNQFILVTLPNGGPMLSDKAAPSTHLRFAVDGEQLKGAWVNEEARTTISFQGRIVPAGNGFNTTLMETSSRNSLGQTLKLQFENLSVDELGLLNGRMLSTYDSSSADESRWSALFGACYATAEDSVLGVTTWNRCKPAK